MILNRFLLCAGLFSTSLITQAQGVHFEVGNWAEVRKKAIEQNRLIYVDVSTSWCGACKILEKIIFPQKAAGDKYNALFVNYKVDAEKGEGVELAKKYQVSSYPTNLFIDPKTERVIYRTSGAPMALTPGDAVAANAFNMDADLAIQESTAPMTWEMYEEAYANGKRDKDFLYEFLLKAKKLKKNNDAIINDCVAILKKAPVVEADVLFLLRQVNTIDNDAIELLNGHKEMINAKNKGMDKYFESVCRGLTHKTLEKAVSQNNPALLDKMDYAMKHYALDSDATILYWFRTQYYEKIGDSVNAWIANKKLGNFLLSLPESYFTEGDKKELEENIVSLRWQMRNLNRVPESQIEEKVKETLKNDTYERFTKTTNVANTLNTMAWTVFEKQPNNKVHVTEALKWSQRATSLGQPLNEWASFADTHAHLLYLSGKKTDAIRLQQLAIERARSQRSEQIIKLEASLKKMQDGTL